MNFVIQPKQEDADAHEIHLLLKQEEERFAEELYKLHFKSEERASTYDYGPPIPVKAEAVKIEKVEEKVATFSIGEEVEAIASGPRRSLRLACIARVSPFEREIKALVKKEEPESDESESESEAELEAEDRDKTPPRTPRKKLVVPRIHGEGSWETVEERTLTSIQGSKSMVPRKRPDFFFGNSQ